MPENETVISDGGNDQQVNAGTAPAAPQQMQQTPPSPQAPAGEKTMVIPHNAMSRIKQEEFNRGREAAANQLAKEAGYESHADFVAALARLRNQPAQQPQQQAARQPQQPASPEEAPEDLASAQANHVANRAAGRQEMAIQRNLEKALNERNRYANQAAELRKAAEAARAEVDAVRAEMHLRTVAAGVGVQDIDYAITLLTREVERLTPEEAEQFDERAFFDKLRQSKPLLFGEAVQPANTGIGGGNAPRPPAPNQVASPAAGRTDARKMDNKQYQELLRSRGINPHAS